MNIGHQELLRCPSAHVVDENLLGKGQVVHGEGLEEMRA